MPQFIHSVIDEEYGEYFHFRVLMSSGSLNILIHVLGWICEFLLDVSLEVE